MRTTSIKTPPALWTTPAPVVYRHEVREEEIDATGFVIPACQFRWCEFARIDYLSQVGVPHPVSAGLDARGQPVPVYSIVSEQDIEFHRAVSFPETAEVATRIGRVGQQSLTFHFAITTKRHRGLVATATAVVLLFEPASNRVIDLPVPLRMAIERLERRPIRMNQNRYRSPFDEESYEFAADESHLATLPGTRRGVPKLIEDRSATTGNSPIAASNDGQQMLDVMRALARKDPSALWKLAREQGMDLDQVEEIIRAERSHLGPPTDR